MEREVVVVDDGQGVLVGALAHFAVPVTRHQMRGHPHPHHPHQQKNGKLKYIAFFYR